MLKTYLGQVYLALAAGIWGGMYVVSKIMLNVIQPIELLWLRYLVALFCLVIFGVATRQSWKIRKKDISLVLVIGLVGYFFSIWASFAGTQLSTAQMGAVITSASPTFMVLFARVFLKERITVRKLVSVCLATAGVLFMVGIGDISRSFALGGLLLGLAALTWGLVSVLVKQVPSDYSLLVVTTYAIFAATTVITPFAVQDINVCQLNLFLQAKVWGGILYIGIVSTAVAFYLWNKGIQMVDASKGGIYLFFQPLIGTLLGWLLLGENVGITFWIGAFLIIGGVSLVIKDF